MWVKCVLVWYSQLLTSVFGLVNSIIKKMRLECRLHPSHSISVFSNSLNNPKFGGSQKSKILIGIPSLDNPMTNLPPKNGWNSHQPPEMELQSLVPNESPLWPQISSRYPGQININEHGHVIHLWKGLLWICKSFSTKPNYMVARGL